MCALKEPNVKYKPLNSSGSVIIYLLIYWEPKKYARVLVQCFSN